MGHGTMNLMEEAIWIGGAIIITFFAVKTSSWLLKRAFTRAATRMKMDPTNYSFLKNTINFFVVVAGVLFLFNKIPEFKRIGSAMLAGAAILTAAIGFAAQQSVANIISGIFIILFKPFRVGDTVILPDANRGVVEDITLRHTVIRDPENRSIIVPNTTINSSTIINSTFADQPVCAFIEVGISYAADIDRAMALMQDEVIKHPLLIDNRNNEQKEAEVSVVTVRVLELGDFAIKLRAWAWAANSGNAFVMKCDLLKAIKERFDKAEIEIPYPSQNVWIKRD
ncbi:MAG: mechanosensitive ion channel protein MscS [Bacteroidetes bacterium]|nr:mechanosensitive ion channel protein MscS [Bacteroidota bacterium]